MTIIGCGLLSSSLVITLVTGVSNYGAQTQAQTQAQDGQAAAGWRREEENDAGQEAGREEGHQEDPGREEENDAVRRTRPKTKGAWAITGLGHGLINWCCEWRFPLTGPHRSTVTNSANYWV